MINPPTDSAGERTSDDLPEGFTQNNPYTFSPVTVTDSLGAALLGLLAIILTVALLRSQARNRQLERRPAQPG